MVTKNGESVNTNRHWADTSYTYTRVLPATSIALIVHHSEFSGAARQVFEDTTKVKKTLRPTVKTSKFKEAAKSEEFWPWANFLKPATPFDIGPLSQLKVEAVRDRGIKRRISKYF